MVRDYSGRLGWNSTDYDYTYFVLGFFFGGVGGPFTSSVTVRSFYIHVFSVDALVGVTMFFRYWGSLYIVFVGFVRL